jgi:ribosomal protein S18 acetylase RimI-like enzyme
MDIERASEVDVDAVADLDVLSFGPPARPYALRAAIREGACWVARREHAIVGFALFDRFLHGHGFLRVIAVHPDHRRQGVATALVSALEAECPTDRLFTATEESNEAMQLLCDALGFVRSGRIEGLEEGEIELIYYKRLPEPR